ncbi:hypothetical protein EMIHUDRAFT_459945, partial [Emiliania huxleyi CCMP1516]|uniref:Right handed beta helix domain-containing protein n=2 Tax=Emiliania huxleyi TaxID=2903 RepID=A0A0D3IBX0_EMIH1
MKTNTVRLIYKIRETSRELNSINMKLKLELVPAAGDKLVLKLSPPPPPLADKQACAFAHVTMRSHLQDACGIKSAAAEESAAKSAAAEEDAESATAEATAEEAATKKATTEEAAAKKATAEEAAAKSATEEESEEAATEESAAEESACGVKDDVVKEDDVEGESSPMKSFAKVGIVPADDGRITLVISASESPSLLGAKACGVNNVNITVAKSATEDVLKKDPAAEKAPDAGAFDSDKAKAMFAAHAPAVFWSKFERPTVVGALKKAAAKSGAEASVDETGVIKNDPALKPVIKIDTALKKAAVCGEALPSVDADWNVSTKEFPEQETAAPAVSTPQQKHTRVIDGWKTASPLRKIERKGEPNLIDRSKKTTKNPTPIGRVDPNGLGEPNLVDCSKSTTPTDPPTAPNGVTTNAPALTPVATGGAPLPSIEEGDADWTVSAKESPPAEKPAPAGISDWTTPSNPRRKKGRKGASAPIVRTKSIAPVGGNNRFGALLGTNGNEGILGGTGKVTGGSTPPTTDSGATANVETTTITTPEGSVSASGWFSWPKFCPTYLLRLFGILALLCLGTAFALSSYSATSALLSSQWHESPTSFPAVTTPFTPASLNGVCEIGGDDTSSCAAIASSDSVPADHPVLARSRLLVPAPRQLVTHSPRAVEGGHEEGRLAGEARCAGNERGAKQASRLLEEAGSDETLFQTGASGLVRAIVDDAATRGQPSLREWWCCCACAAVLLLQACGACWLLRSGAASGQRASKAVRPRLSKSRSSVALLLLISALPVAGSGEASWDYKGVGWCTDANNGEGTARKFVVYQSLASAKEACFNDFACVAIAFRTEPGYASAVYTSTGCTDDCTRTEWLEDRSLIVGSSGWCTDANNGEGTARKFVVYQSLASAKEACFNDFACVAIAFRTEPGYASVVYTSTGCTDDCTRTEWLEDRSLIVGSSGDSRYECYVSWDLWCGGTVVLSSAPYASGEPFQAEYGVSLSPGVECELVMKDSYGDGWNGASWSGLGQEGLTVASGAALDNVEYVAAGYTASGAPYYRASTSSFSYLYWDPDCNGNGFGANWIVDADQPSTTASSDLDGDGSCNFRAYINSYSSSPPLGTTTWTAENRNAIVFIPPGARLAFSSNVGCSDEMHISVRSSGEGATLDGKKSSRMFDISGGCSLYLEALHFVDGRGDRGGAVRASGAGDIAMKDVSFTGCEADLYGGGMLVYGSGDVSLEGASFSECTAGNYGGGMSVESSGDVSLDGASFSECTAGEKGGGMFVYQNSGDVSLEGASFSKCTADWGGGMLVKNSGDVSLERASFSECTAGVHGGGVYVENSGGVSLDGASFSECTAAWHGGGMHVIRSGDVSLERASFSECTAAEWGGGMSVWSSGDLSLDGASFSECTAGWSGGGMRVENSGDVSLESASFVECTSGSQAALYLNGIERLALTNSQFVDNMAEASPAALFFASSVGATDSLLRNTTFSGNSAPGDITILAASPLTWDCPLGYWMPNVGQLFGDLSGCNRLCAEECRAFGGDGQAGQARCVGNVDPGEASGRRAQEAGLDYCADAFAGPECQLCREPNHYLDADGAACNKCVAVGTAAGHMAGIALGLCVAFGLVALAYSVQRGQTEWRKERFIGLPLRIADRTGDAIYKIGLIPKFKILFGFYQVCLVLSTTYSARLPERYTGWTEALAEAVFIDWSGIVLPVQCLAHTSRLVAVAISPIGVIALLLFAGIVLRLCARWRRARRGAGCESGSEVDGATSNVLDAAVFSWPAEVALGVLDLTPAGFVLIFLFAPSVSATVLRAWSCQAKSPNALTKATAFLHREYKRNWYWWEAADLARKLFLTGFVLLVAEEEDSFVRLVVAVLVCSCYAVAIALVQPYKRFEDNILAVATSLVLLLLFLGASWTTIFLNIELRFPGDEPGQSASAVLGFRSENGLVNWMLVLAAAALLIFLVGTIIAIRRLAKVPTIRLVSTKQPPELALVDGLTWHLFLSHIWSTGQDAVAVIKNELKLLIPGIKIFLDVDDLKDIGSLEDYVDRTQNCLREIQTSLEKRKPLVLVQEADPAKGGGTLQALPARPQLDDPAGSAIALATHGSEGRGWAQTTWHRIDEYQRVSLKIISEALLLSSPNYSSLTSLPLFIPGEVQGQPISFSKSVVLWASPFDEGADELATKLATNFSGLTVSTAEEAGDATHMLLYLNADTWSDERLAEQ